MAITSQVWTKYAIEENPVGPGDNYTATTFIDHLIAWFTANTSQWTISSSGTNYVELKPPVGTSIEPDDRILFWGGVAPVSTATSGNTGTISTYSYVCWAPNAGTTGPDNLPSAGIPYTGVNSSLLVMFNESIIGSDRLQVYQSNDCLCIWAGIDGGTAGVSQCFVGRAFNPVNTSDQVGIVAGMSDGAAATWSQTIQASTTMWTADTAYVAADHRIVVQLGTADSSQWDEVRRLNGWAANQFRNAATDLRYFFNIILGSNTGPQNEFRGTVLFAKGGPARRHDITIADGGGTLGYSQSVSLTLDTSSTWYLWNE